MAEFVTPIIDIISRLLPYCARHTRYLCKLQENMVLLRTAMNELQEARDAVQRRVVEAEADPNEQKKRTDPVRGWLQRVETIEGEVEVILKKANEQLSRERCLGGCCPPNNCWSNYKVGKSLVMKKASVDELKENGHFQEVTYNLPPPSVQDMNLESTVGMESMFDNVWGLITSTGCTDDKAVVRIMGLYGHGGVGKTTLLKKINNEFNKISGEDGFDHVVIFVVVSKPINYEAIQTQIGERLRLSLQGDERRRANEIFNVLRNKNFVILLDDIWERVDLPRIGIPSPLLQCNSSKLIFTTRNKEVCGFMEATHKFQVECLPWDKAWSLFQEKVGEEALTSLEKEKVGELAKLVAKECGGLPLALITIGRAMSTTKSVEEWKNAITTLKNFASEFPGMSDEVLPRLKLSYDYLGNPTIKSCFLYCALFPEDHSIEIAQLIEYWIGEGFLNGFNNLDEARSHGHHVIQTLKRACLLESGYNEDGFSAETYVKMHDIIRDLALWIVNDCKSSKTTGKFLVASNVCEGWKNAERIFWMIPVDVIKNGLQEPPTSPNLRTLIVRGPCGHSISLPQSFFQFTPSLRVLDLSRTLINELPVESRKLVKLKFLDLSDTYNLRKIPPGVIANLSELRVLRLCFWGFGDWELEEEEDGTGLSFRELDGLKQLQEVTLIINTSLALDKLLCNQKLRTICTGLTLRNCINLKSISFPPSSISKGLGNLTSLKHLCILYCLELEELTLFIDVDEETNTTTTSTAGLLISNNNKLEKLFLYNLPRLNNIVWGEKYHHYMAAQQQQQQLYYLHVSPFQNLYEINIGFCNALKDLTWLVYVENLKTLWVHKCPGLETIIGGAGGGGGVFGRLEHLHMIDIPKLKSICRHALAFPSIKTIKVSDSPELKKLPLDSGSNINNTLKQIQGSTEWWNELHWEDETIKSKFLPYFNK